MHVVHGANQVTFNVQTLGEYPTTVNRIRLLDSNLAIIWEVAAQNGDAQIYRLVLKAGDNSALLDADHGAYRVIEPKTGNRFVLSNGSRYRIELWGRDNVLSRRSIDFVLGR
jgi:hypothetical protein